MGTLAGSKPSVHTALPAELQSQSSVGAFSTCLSSLPLKDAAHTFLAHASQLTLTVPRPPTPPRPSQLRRFEHEGDWARALVSYDLVLQNLAAPPAGGTIVEPGALGGSAAKRGGGGGTPGRRRAAAGGRAGAIAPGGSSLAGAGAGQGAGELEGVSYAAAVAGLIRSLHQLGAAHLLQAFQQQQQAGPGGAAPAGQQAQQAAAAGLGQWGAAAAPPSPDVAAPASISSSLRLAASTGARDAGGEAFERALSAAIAGLAAGSGERCKAAVWRASRELVGGLVSASLEGAANVNAALVQLQMLQVGEMLSIGLSVGGFTEACLLAGVLPMPSLVWLPQWWC